MSCEEEPREREVSEAGVKALNGAAATGPRQAHKGRRHSCLKAAPSSALRSHTASHADSGRGKLLHDAALDTSRQELPLRSALIS